MPRPRTIITLFSMAVLLVLFSGCASAQPKETPAVMTGTVEFLNIEGGCWIIRTDDGKTLSPVNLPRSAHQNGMRVSFTASPAPGTVNACMSGEPVRLLSIEPLPALNSR